MSLPSTFAAFACMGLVVACSGSSDDASKGSVRDGETDNDGGIVAVAEIRQVGRGLVAQSF